MILTETFSEIGRSTAQHLDNLRRQLGVGIDPAYDYSQMTELQKKLTTKRDKKPKDDGSGGGGPLEELRRALKEATSPAVEEPEEVEEPVHGKSGMFVTHKKELKKPSCAFLVRSRSDIDALDPDLRFRAPPVGTYRAKYETTEPRVKVRDFALREGTKSRSLTMLEEQVASLQAEKQPYEHLLKPVTSVELLDEAPQRLRPRFCKIDDFNKGTVRPDLIKSANIHFNDNSFTAGVLDGDFATTKLTRQPMWDFAKLSTTEDKPRETFFQPGQYKVDVTPVRAKLEVKNIPFQKMTKRRPLRETVGRTEIKKRAGDHLPDRSLARSCPHLSSRKRLLIPDLSKYTERPPPGEHRKPYHDASDPEVDKKVMHRFMTHDEMEATKATWTKPRQVENFGESLDRLQQFKSQRKYGEDRAVKLAREFAAGPRSVELLDEIGTSQILRPRVLVRDFERMAAREKTGNYVEVPPRQRDQSDHMKFGRAPRQGDARPEAEVLSPSAGEIVRLRAARTYDGFDGSR